MMQLAHPVAELSDSKSTLRRLSVSRLIPPPDTSPEENAFRQRLLNIVLFWAGLGCLAIAVAHLAAYFAIPSSSTILIAISFAIEVLICFVLLFTIRREEYVLLASRIFLLSGSWQLFAFIALNQPDVYLVGIPGAIVILRVAVSFETVRPRAWIGVIIATFLSAFLVRYMVEYPKVELGDARPLVVVGVSVAAFIILGLFNAITTERLQKLLRESETARRELAAKHVELESANTHIEVAYRTKSDFLANVSHELRTPLNGIIGQSGIMLAGMTGDLSDRQRHKLVTVYDSAQHLLALVNDLLDLEKADSGRLQPNETPVNIRQLATGWCDQIRPAAEKKELEFTLKLDDALPEMVTVDTRLLTQVALNLLNNGVKYTEKGFVRLTLGWDGRDHVLSLIVSDTGLGIPAHELDAIFDEFHRVSGSSLNQEGTGLGLSIVRKISRVVGGRVGVQSQFGEGSTFTFVYPLGKVLTTGAES